MILLNMVKHSMKKTTGIADRIQAAAELLLPRLKNDISSPGDVRVIRNVTIIGRLRVRAKKCVLRKSLTVLLCTWARYSAKLNSLQRNDSVITGK